jgi:gas vesicle protein
MVKRSSTKGIAIGAAIAAGVGYLAGILTAPKSGKETRQDIASAAIKAKSEAEKRLKQLYSELSDLINDGKKRAGTLKAAAKTDLEAVIGQALAAKEKVREVLSAIHEGESDDKDLDSAVKDVTKALDDLKTFLAKHEPQK